MVIITIFCAFMVNNKPIYVEGKRLTSPTSHGIIMVDFNDHDDDTVRNTAYINENRCLYEKGKNNGR